VRKSGEDYVPVQTWDDLAFITNRVDVQGNETGWKRLLVEIIAHLNELFESGQIQGRQFIKAYASGGIAELVLQNHAGVAEALRIAAREDGAMNDRITLWWSKVEAEYDEDDRFLALSKGA
jgi:hypothetical protein